MIYNKYSFVLDETKTINLDYELNSLLVFCNGFFLDRDSYVADDTKTLNFPFLNAGYGVDVYIIDDTELKESLVLLLSNIQSHETSINNNASSIAGLVGDILSHETSINNNTSSIAGLVGNISENETSITNIQTSLSSLGVGGVFSKNANGYLELANGFLIQWGSYVSNDDGWQTVNFPISFSQAYSISTHLPTSFEVKLYNSYFKFDRFDSLNGSPIHKYIAIGLI